MKTMTTVEAVERTPKGAFKVTFPPNVIAGTLDAEIGALAERLAAEENANPVEVTIQDIGDGKLEIKAMQEITAPEVLGGPAEEAPVVGEDVAKTEAVAPGSDPTGEAKALVEEPTLDAVIVEGLAAYSDEAILAEVARRNERTPGIMGQADDLQYLSGISGEMLVGEIGERLARLEGLEK